MAKTSQQVIVSIPDKLDIMRLAIIRQESQAEVTRRLIQTAMPFLKQTHAEDLDELNDALDGFDNVEDVFAALTEMTTVRTRSNGLRRTLTLADLQTDRFPWPASRGASAKPAA